MALSDLENRIAKLERSRFQCPKDVVEVDESMRRARQAVESAQLYSAVWKWVPPAYYYTWPLEERAVCLNAPSIHQLCKSLLMENKKAQDIDDDPTHYNPRFVLVVIQYASTLNTKQLANAIRALSPVDSRLDETQFDFRIATQADNDRLTGYSHNSVTPFGLLDNIPIVLSQAIVPLKFFWMGGGHVHLKLGMSVTDFCHALNPIVAEISQPRSGMDVADLD